METNLSDSKIGLSLLPEQSKNYALRKGGKFTIMVAGAVGSGKSTFLNTLLGADLLPTTDSEGSGTRNINVNTFNLVEDKFQLLITTIDTPGFGQRFNNQFAWVPISNFIDEQLRLYLFRCEQPERSKVFDTRVHCCIYFIVPTSTGLTPLDILAMKDLSKRVNLIPVVSKGDTLTKEELADFKEIVWSTLQLHDIKVCDLILDQQVTAKINAQMPYSIIASNTYHKNERNELVRGRKYNWGIAEVENNNHCDFLKLREVLMSENMLDLINSTEAQFELYRSRCLKERFDKYFGSEGKSEILEKVNELKSMLRDKDPIMEHAEKKMKEKYAEVISNQEKTFREWKKALVEKQEALNQDIEKDHVLLLKLTAFIDAQTSGESTPEFTVDSISDSEKAPLSRGEIGVEG
ncbi:Septin-domain-containing protein [Scheffersomyces xylosifermentans]|uniref:Septin-domain-containing protein n=1 Tax=Scheffersomyces xylosifermentans TaxID=1304137 RepID=UPI00315D8186